MIANAMYVISQVIIPGRIIIRNRDTALCRVECRYLLTTDYYLCNDAMLAQAMTDTRYYFVRDNSIAIYFHDKL